MLEPASHPTLTVIQSATDLSPQAGTAAILVCKHGLISFSFFFYQSGSRVADYIKKKMKSN